MGPAERSIQRALRDKGAGLTPRRVTIYEETDSFDDPAWRILLDLPAPIGDTWDQAAIFELRREAVEEFDQIAEASGKVLTGTTIALVTTQERVDDSTQAETLPDEGEGVASEQSGTNGPGEATA